MPSNMLKSFGLIVSLFCLTVNVESSFSQTTESLKRGVVKVIVEVDGSRKIGTGFIVEKDDYGVNMVTASHVVGDNKKVQIEFYTRRNRKYTATVTNLEGGEKGLALISVEGTVPSRLKVLNFGKPPRSGAILAIGHPRYSGVFWAVVEGNIVGLKEVR